MKIKEFLKNTKKTLGIKPSDDDNTKKERLEDLIEKLKVSKNELKKELKKIDIDDDRKVELEDEISIYKQQIKKGKKILEKRSNKEESSS